MASSTVPAVVLLSGGLDSSVLLHYVVGVMRAQPVHAISFNYGQRHSRELDCAHSQAAHARVAVHRVLDISFMGELLERGTTLVSGGSDVPNLAALTPGELTQPPTYVPNRNMMLLSMAAAYAEAHDIFDIYYGAQAQDEYGYWDCTREFLDRMNAVLALNRDVPVNIHAPFVDKKKADIVALGRDLSVRLDQTWSCYRGGNLACGECPTCVERLKAFADLGMSDPLTYAQHGPAHQ